MSDLLNSASLVLIPSGYKEDTVYSAVPTDGAGDLSFTRASNGTRINSAGLVEVCPWNLLEQSETFNNAYWSVDNGTITANSTTAPNGTVTADTFTKTIGSTAYLYNGSFNLGIGEFTQSIYAKANASSSIRLEFVTGAFGRGAACIFNLSNGTAGTITIYGGVSGFTASIESVGNGWYRCSIGGTITIADTYYYEISITTGSIYIWGAQLNIGSTAKPYFPTTDRLNVPRLTYQNGGGGCPSLLLEKQSTNLLTWSEDFSNAAWIKFNATITANDAISPDGTQNADKVVFAGANHYFYQQTSFVGQATASIYVKGTAGQTISIDNTQVITEPLITLTGEWQRITLTSTTSGGSVQGIAISTFQSATARTIYVWGAQLEASTYPTSYIPTTSASATRVADACSKTGISSLFGTNQGTFFVDIANAIELDFPQVTIDDNSNTNRIVLYREAINGYWGLFLSASGATASYSSTVSSINGKFAIAYNSSGFLLYKDGTQILSFSNTVPSSISAVRYNGRATGDFYTNKEIKEFVLFPTKLTATELAQLTA